MDWSKGRFTSAVRKSALDLGLTSRKKERGGNFEKEKKNWFRKMSW